MAELVDIVLVHGWGLNSGVWRRYVDELVASLPMARCHVLDIAGYGSRSDKSSLSDIHELAIDCLAQAPQNAIWVGWSLGGLIAMKSALISPCRVLGLQLINATPKFVVSDDWQNGVDIDVFQKFCDELSADYERTLKVFLLLQAGANKGARELATMAHRYISDFPAPSKPTLQAGIDCLANTDLRQDIKALAIHSRPTQVVAGLLDRVTKPQSSEWLAAHLGADLVTINTGHAPFMTHASEVTDALSKLVNQVVLT